MAIAIIICENCMNKLKKRTWEKSKTVFVSVIHTISQYDLLQQQDTFDSSQVCCPKVFPKLYLSCGQ